MARLIKLDVNPDIHLEGQESFLNPDFLYIPLPREKVQMHKQKIVQKGSCIYSGMESPVSGRLLRLEKCLLPSGESVNALELANDFQEKSIYVSATRRKINNLTKENMLASIYNERLKEQMKNTEVETIVVSGIDDEPYIFNESFLAQKQTKCILDTIDALLNIYHKSKAIVALKSTDSESIISFQNFLGSYQNITLKILNPFYLLGKEKFLIQNLHIKKKYLYFRMSDIESLHVNLKKRMPSFEKYITIAGDVVSSKVIQTKLGVKVSDVYHKFYRENLANYDVYVNGLMQGKILDITKVIVTNDFEGLIIMKKKNSKEKACIKCGKCISVCPIRSNPLLAYRFGKKVKCIECGLCTYICPSYIPLQKYLSGEENE